MSKLYLNCNTHKMAKLRNVLYPNFCSVDFFFKFGSRDPKV